MPTEEEQLELLAEELAEEEGLREESAEAFSTAEPISFYGADFDVHGLVRRLNDGDIVIPNFRPPATPDHDLAGFQRSFVWRKYQMDRFVESLLLGYPVPGIFLVQQTDRKLLVLDGQQRLRTLQQFFAGQSYDGRRFELEHVADNYVGKTYESLEPEDRRQLDNSFIHATVIRYDAYEDTGAGEDTVYQLFERLNASGSNLYPHEIRVALYPGRLVDFVAELNNEPEWRVLWGPVSPRLKDQEQILRFLALYTEADKYKRPLKGFLNTFVKEHRDLQGLDVESLRDVFKKVCEALVAGPGASAFRTTRQVNAALVDSVMVGLARRLEVQPAPNPGGIQGVIDALLADSDFQAAIARATADEVRVNSRLGMATDAFATL
jgi:hypothetical protein